MTQPDILMLLDDMSDNESAIIVCTDGMMYDIQLYY